MKVCGILLGKWRLLRLTGVELVIKTTELLMVEQSIEQEVKQSSKAICVRILGWLNRLAVMTSEAQSVKSKTALFFRYFSSYRWNLETWEMKLYESISSHLGAVGPSWVLSRYDDENFPKGCYMSPYSILEWVLKIRAFLFLRIWWYIQLETFAMSTAGLESFGWAKGVEGGSLKGWSGRVSLLFERAGICLEQ
jgi:hypothetical protein